jgi:hypothetical protein
LWCGPTSRHRMHQPRRRASPRVCGALVLAPLGPKTDQALEWGQTWEPIDMWARRGGVMGL